VEEKIRILKDTEEKIQILIRICNPVVRDPQIRIRSKTSPILLTVFSNHCWPFGNVNVRYVCYSEQWCGFRISLMRIRIELFPLIFSTSLRIETSFKTLCTLKCKKHTGNPVNRNFGCFKITFHFISVYSCKIGQIHEDTTPLHCPKYC
jgi:hypothetical protein